MLFERLTVAASAIATGTAVLSPAARTFCLVLGRIDRQRESPTPARASSSAVSLKTVAD
jgi:hypothetical protein